MAKKKTGIITIKVNGKSLEGKPGIKFVTGGFARTLTKAGGRITGFSEEVEPSTVTVNIAHDADVSIDEVRGWTDVTLVIETDSGAVYQVTGAVLTKPPELSDGDGGLSLEFGGPPAEAI